MILIRREGFSIGRKVRSLTKSVVSSSDVIPCKYSIQIVSNFVALMFPLLIADNKCPVTISKTRN